MDAYPPDLSDPERGIVLPVLATHLALGLGNGDGGHVSTLFNIRLKNSQLTTRPRGEAKWI